MNNLELYNKAFAEAFPSEKVSSDLRIGTISSWDSTGHMLLIEAIEETFDIMLDTEDIIKFTSYEEGKAILKKYDIDI